MRLAPMVAPMMHRVDVTMHYYFVPNWLIFDKWDKFITGGLKGDDTPVLPYYALGSSLWDSGILKEGSLLDYMGYPIPTVKPDGSWVRHINALPFRAYQLIYNEYYLDQNLQNPVVIEKGEGQDYNRDVELRLRKRSWEKDYFTSALPWAQKGAPVSIPIAGQADIGFAHSSDNRTYVSTSNTHPLSDSSSLSIDSVVGSGGTLSAMDNTFNTTPIEINNSDQLYADLSSISGVSINDLRESFQLQKWLERNARAGSRYIESILAHFGVKSSDARLQRPEYLGGGKTPIVVSEVLQTSSTDETTPQGNMAGHGLSVGNTNSFRQSFEEHGYVIGIMSVLPKTSYQNGVPRHFLRQDKLDYLWPEFAGLGEQEVMNAEVFEDFTAAAEDTSTFGYQGRYNEYRYCPSTVHGDFRSTLDFWHMGRKFTSKPALNSDFIVANPTHRVFAVTDETKHKLWCQIYHNFTAIRPLPYINEPGLIDHN